MINLNYPVPQQPQIIASNYVPQQNYPNNIYPQNVVANVQNIPNVQNAPNVNLAPAYSTPGNNLCF